MLISKVQVLNYKSFRDSGWIEFRSGINIITGQNSAGKTALLEALASNFQNIPVNLFSKSINYLLENDVIEIADYTNETIATHGLKYIAIDTGCKSGYLFAIKTIDNKFIGTLGLDFSKRKTKLDMESINHLQVHATSVGGVLMGHLER